MQRSTHAHTQTQKHIYTQSQAEQQQREREHADLKRLEVLNEHMEQLRLEEMRQRQAYQQQQSPPPDADMSKRADTFRPIQPHEMPSPMHLSPSPRIGPVSDANANGIMINDSDSARRPYTAASPRGLSPQEMYQASTSKGELDASSGLRLAIAQNAYSDSARRTPPPPSPPPRSPYFPRTEKPDRTGSWDVNNGRMSPSVGVGVIRPFDGSQQTSDVRTTDGMYQSPAIRALEAQQRPPSLEGGDVMHASPASRAVDVSRPGCLQPFGSMGRLMCMYV
jgi:hypothetical protein